MEYVKLINGNIEYYEKPENLLGSYDNDALFNGYLPLTYQIGTGGTYELNGVVYIETPQQENIVSLDSLKQIKVQEVTNNFTILNNNNFDSVLPPIILESYKANKPKATAVFNWTWQKGVERATKIKAINEATTIDELNAIDTNFTNVEKPYLTEELMEEYAGFSLPI